MTKLMELTMSYALQHTTTIYFFPVDLPTGVFPQRQYDDRCSTSPSLTAPCADPSTTHSIVAAYVSGHQS